MVHHPPLSFCCLFLTILLDFADNCTLFTWKLPNFNVRKVKFFKIEKFGRVYGHSSKFRFQNAFFLNTIFPDAVILNNKILNFHCTYLFYERNDRIFNWRQVNIIAYFFQIEISSPLICFLHTKKLLFEVGLTVSVYGRQFKVSHNTLRGTCSILLNHRFDYSQYNWPWYDFQFFTNIE